MREIMIKNSIDIVTSLITLGGIWVAYRSSYKQIKNSNEQALFEKRLKIFMVSEGLYRLVIERKTMLDIPNEPDMSNAVHFHDMINNSELNYLVNVMPEPLNLKGPSPVELPIAQREFLTKKEEMLQQAQAAELIFEKPVNFTISNFMSAYISLLDGRRKYEIFLKNGIKQYGSYLNSEHLEIYDYLEKKLGEKKYRQECLIEPITKLAASFEDYKSKQEQIKKQISLTK
ncbi:hypothetical protein ACPBEI_04875 [Latilactobacillus sakei]